MTHKDSILFWIVAAIAVANIVSPFVPQSLQAARKPVTISLVLFFAVTLMTQFDDGMRSGKLDMWSVPGIDANGNVKSIDRMLKDTNKTFNRITRFLNS